MSSPGAGFLEGLAGGAESGYTFREGVKRNRRQQALDERIAQLRELAESRAGAGEQREQTTFDQQQDAYRRAQALRTEVGTFLQAPVKQSLGEYLDGREGTRRIAPPLSRDATTAKAVGNTLGRFGGVNLDDEEELILGSGMVDPNALMGLVRLRAAAARRGASVKLPITLDHAYQVIDNIYGIWRGGERIGHHLSPAQRASLARQMVAGTDQGSSYPDIKGEAREEPPRRSAAPPQGRSLADWVKGLFTKPKEGTSTLPDAEEAPDGDQPPNMGMHGDRRQRMEQARAMLSEYRDLPQEDLVDALHADGYDEEEIRAILNSLDDD